jgi:GWxTD domain-containing protein
LSGIACKSVEQKKFESLPQYKEFYMMARFIMTDYERRMFKYLPDSAARDKFIKEFWKRRDPTPDTDENENYDEFMNRIAFANRNFRERTKGMGWNTVRGRILLQLGFPIERKREHYNLMSENRYVPYEIWYYPRFELVLGFIDKNDDGKYELMDPPPGLLSAIDEAVYEFDINKKYRGKKSIKFNGIYKKGMLIISFPIKNILFKKFGDIMSVQYKFDITVFSNYKEIDKISIKKIIEKDKDEFLKLKKLSVEIPYELQKKGKYYFDILVTDLINKSRYRRYISYRKL